MRVGIIGAGRIGKFHIREFFGAGCEIVAIFQNKKEKAEENAKILSETYKKPIKPYWNLEKFFKEKLDIVSICTPCEFHSFYIKKSLEKGLNVFSEKPFVFDSEDKNFKIAKRLVELAKEKNKIVSVNTQWAC
ncbi:MAG: Gfo/Idh/MocA family oxidoreductase, partial [archaeon]